MPSRPLTHLELFKAAGYDVEDHPPSQEQQHEAQNLLTMAATDPVAAAIEILRVRRLALLAQTEGGKAAEAALKLEGILTGLLKTEPMLCHVEGLCPNGGDRPLALCRVFGELRQIPIHPTVPPDQIEKLLPWEYALVNASNKEMVVIGSYSHPDLLEKSYGAIVEFKDYHDRAKGLVRVAREGHDEEVVRLSPELRERSLAPPLKMVLQRDDQRWAIGAVSADRPRSKFEVSIEDAIHTRLEDVAGLDPIIEPLVKDIVLRLVRSDIREKFDLRPLNGVLIYSYQPGTGKTSLIRGLARWLYELGKERDFEVVLYVVKPNELKNKFHGEDARIVREDLCGSIRARQALPRTKILIQIVVFDEIDSLGRRAGGDEGTILSPAQNDAVQALLAEMDGMTSGPKSGNGSNPPYHVLWFGLSNRPDMVDLALKREGRFADLVLEVPALSIEGAENVLAVYARGTTLPWYIDDEVRSSVPEDLIRSRFLRPALALAFNAPVLRYASEGQRTAEVPAGVLMAGVHYMNALNRAKEKAATRQLLGSGIPAISWDDVVDGLLDQARSVAKTLESDRHMLGKILRLHAPVTRVEVVPEEEISEHRYLRLQSAPAKG